MCQSRGYLLADKPFHQQEKLTLFLACVTVASLDLHSTFLAQELQFKSFPVNFDQERIQSGPSTGISLYSL